ncbi:MAG: hypothetical protein ACTSVV_16425 [Promethearchaeota archaeon]
MKNSIKRHAKIKSPNAKPTIMKFTSPKRKYVRQQKKKANLLIMPKMTIPWFLVISKPTIK